MLTDRTDADHVVLVEIYVDEAAAAAHKETRALRHLAGHRRADDGPAAGRHPVRQHLARRRRLVSAASFDLTLPTDVRFGAGRAAEAPDVVAGWGARRVLVVTGRATGRPRRWRR